MQKRRKEVDQAGWRGLNELVFVDRLTIINLKKEQVENLYL